MSILFGLVEFVIAAAIVSAVANSFRKRYVRAPWWIAFGLATLVGTIVGIWFGFVFQYRLSPRVVVYSFPIPAAFHALEAYDDGTHQWVDFITPAPLLTAIANAILFIGISVAIVWMANTLRNCDVRRSL